MLKVTPISRPETLQELAYKSLKNHLTSGKLEPDTIYSANQFADLLGVSRTPVREALLQLAAEGHLVLVEGRGFKVREYSEKEIRDFFEVRRLLETYVAERVAGKLSAPEEGALQATLKRMAERARKGDPAGFLDADREFHLALLKPLANPLLESLMNGIRDRMSVFALKAMMHEGRGDEILREHRKILESLADPKRAVRAVEEHLRKTEEVVLRQRTLASAPPSTSSAEPVT